MPGAPPIVLLIRPLLLPPVFALWWGRGGGIKGPASPSSSPTPWWGSHLAGTGHSTQSHTQSPSHWVSEPPLGLGEDDYFGTLNRLPSKRHLSVELHSHLPVSSPPRPPRSERKSWCFWPLLWRTEEETCCRWTPPPGEGRALGGSWPLSLTRGFNSLLQTL